MNKRIIGTIESVKANMSQLEILESKLLVDDFVMIDEVALQ